MTRWAGRRILASDIEFFCDADRRAFYLRTEPQRFKKLMGHVVIGPDGKLVKR